MGLWLSRNGRTGVEDIEPSLSFTYRYPPKNGANFFHNHFIMGGEKFDSPQPESFLFGENSDLNFLSGRTVSFPYPRPQTNEPTKTLSSLVNIRRDSVLLREVLASSEPAIENSNRLYNIEFVFDADVDCDITLHYFCVEENSATSGLSYNPVVSADGFSSPTYRYQKGPNQRFAQPSHTIKPSMYAQSNLMHSDQSDVLPVAIHISVCNPEDAGGVHSHTTIGTFDISNVDNSYTLKALKQKIYVDGLCYLLQEVYGVENKSSSTPIDVNDDSGAECVVCMCDLRDTIILPCRHLCLCNACADSLRYQAINCPICRSPFRALLQIKAVQKMSSNASHPDTLSCVSGDGGFIPGYRTVPLVEALNGTKSEASTSRIPSGKRVATARKKTASSVPPIDTVTSSVSHSLPGSPQVHRIPKGGGSVCSSSRDSSTSASSGNNLLPPVRKSISCGASVSIDQHYKIGKVARESSLSN